MWTILRGHGVPIRRMAMDGDKVSVAFLNSVWRVLGIPQGWCLSLDISRQFVILKARSEYQIAITDPSHWIKVFRYDKLKPKGVFYLVGPTQAEFCFTGEIFQRPGSLLNGSASKMDYSIAARFVRVRNLQRIRDAYDNVVAAIGPALDVDGQGVVPGGDVDHGELDALQSLLRQYAGLYRAMMPVVCLQIVTSCVFEPEQRLTVGLYDLPSIVLPSGSGRGCRQLREMGFRWRGAILAALRACTFGPTQKRQ
jgi:hypothetical protein